MSEQQTDYDTTSDTDHTQPTPGPWIRQHPEELDPLVDAESGEHLVTCMATDVPFEEAAANARFIAAAPELLAACEALTEAVPPEEDGAASYRKALRASRAARRAIAKVRNLGAAHGTAPSSASGVVESRAALEERIDLLENHLAAVYRCLDSIHVEAERMSVRQNALQAKDDIERVISPPKHD